MIVDSSAVLAVLLGEPDGALYDEAIAAAPISHMSAANFLETAMVFESQFGSDAGQELDVYLDESDIELVPVTLEHSQGARRAWRRYGKGNHPAGLNFGDCFAYALAEATREPLLYKGRDFSLTDIEAA